MSKLYMTGTRAHQPLSHEAGQVAEHLRSVPPQAIGSDVGVAIFTPESRGNIGEQQRIVAENACDSFESLMSSMHEKLSKQPKTVKVFNAATQLTAEVANPDLVFTPESRATLARTAMMMAGAQQALGSRQLTSPAAAQGMDHNVLDFGHGATMNRDGTVFTAEAFKNYDLENSRVFSAMFNYSVVDFDQFIRTFWRPVTVAPETSFVTLIVNVLTVFNGMEHNLDGKNRDWRRQNLVRAVADHTILSTDLTRAYPVVQTGENDNRQFFSQFVTPVDKTQGAGHPIKTAPIRTGVEGTNLVSLAQPGWLVKNGPLDHRDGLANSVSLASVYLKLDSDLLYFPVSGIPMTDFNEARQGNVNRLNLSWTSASLAVGKDTLNNDKTDLVDLKSVKDLELTLRIRVDIQADLDIETGECTLNSQKPSIRSLHDKDGNEVPVTDSRYTTIKAALAACKEVALDIEAYRHNQQRRQRGQLINIRQFREYVSVPWRDPIAAERPAAGSNEQDTADLTALISACRIRVHNEGITNFLMAEEVIASQIVDTSYVSFDAPTTLGAGRHYVLPTYVRDELDMLEVVDSIKSHERTQDIQAAIVSRMRDMLAHAWTKSEYQAASDAMSGGTRGKPKVAILTDPVTARYILEPSDLRTLVDFEPVVVPVLDHRIRGKIRMVFITDDGGTDVDFLNFGYLFWSPESVVVANMSRTGGFNRETQVQPRYKFYVSCPIMVSLDVKNITEALAKLAVKVTVAGPVAVNSTDVTPAPTPPGNGG